MSIGHSGRWPFRSAGDTAIIEILDGIRYPVKGDTEAIIARMTAVPFDSRRRDLPRPLVNLIRRHGYALDEQSTELTHHWAKHVLGDGQWAVTTTEATYFDDIRRAISYPASGLFL